jgi:hypothetical protein
MNKTNKTNKPDNDEIYVIAQSLVVIEDEQDEFGKDPDDVVCLHLGFFTKPSKANKVCQSCNKGKKRDEYGNKPFQVRAMRLSPIERS